MKKYIKLTILLMKMNFIKDLIYSFNAIFNFISANVYLLTFILVLEYSFDYFDEIKDYSFNDMLLLMLIGQAWWYANVMFVRKNFQHIAESINNGALDRYLIRPISLRLIIPFMEFDWRHVFPLIVVIILIAIKVDYSTVSFLDGITAVLLFMNSIIITYLFTAVFVALNFWAGRNYSVFDITFYMPELSGLPKSFFTNRVISIIFTFIVPVILIANPSFNALTMRSNTTLILSSLAMALLLFILAELIWRRGLKAYTSAN